MESGHLVSLMVFLVDEESAKLKSARKRRPVSPVSDFKTSAPHSYTVYFNKPLTMSHFFELWALFLNEKNR
jgi:hypothetical protein